MVTFAASKWPQLYDSSFSKRQAVLGTAFDVAIDEQLLDDGSASNPGATSSGNGQCVLDFQMPVNDPSNALLQNEMCVLVNYPADALGQKQDVFVIRSVTTGTESGNKVFKVHAEARWYDLGTAPAVTVPNPLTTPTAALTAVLAGTGWTIGSISATLSGGPSRTFQVLTAATPLAAVRALPSVFGGEIVFDTVNRTVSLLTQRGRTSVVALYARGSNVSDDSRLVDTTQLLTRLYPLGASGVDITTVNGGVGYLENYSWYDSQNPPWPRVVKSGESSNNTLTDPTLLKNWGQQQLAMLCLPKVTYTVTPVMLQTDVVPGLGDTVMIVDKSIALNAKARITQRTLNLIQPWNSTLQINTSAFNLASALPGGAPRGSVVPVAALDNLAPAAPGTITVTGTDTIDGNGNHVEYLNFSWLPTTTNADGSLIADLNHYEVQYRIGSNAWISAGSTSTTALQSGPMPPGAAFSVQVRAVDNSSNPSAWKVFTGTTPGVPTSTLNAPSGPVLDGTTFPLTIRATWDGKDSSALTYPANFDHLEVHISTVAGFTPGTATLRDTLRAPGTAPLTGLTAGTRYMVKFRAVDTAGFLSAASPEITATPSGVQDGMIASMSIAKLLAGSLVADMTVSSRIKTADTGARVELNSAGLWAYNAAGSPTVQIKSADGTAQFSGGVFSGGQVIGADISTAVSGQRIELVTNPGGGSQAIKFYSGDPYESTPSTIQVQSIPGNITMSSGLRTDVSDTTQYGTVSIDSVYGVLLQAIGNSGGTVGTLSVGFGTVGNSGRADSVQIKAVPGAGVDISSEDTNTTIASRIKNFNSPGLGGTEIVQDLNSLSFTYWPTNSTSATSPITAARFTSKGLMTDLSQGTTVVITSFGTGWAVRTGYEFRLTRLGSGAVMVNGYTQTAAAQGSGSTVVNAGVIPSWAVPSKPRVVSIGGGLGGTSAAWTPAVEIGTDGSMKMWNGVTTAGGTQNVSGLYML